MELSWRLLANGVASLDPKSNEKSPSSSPPLRLPQ
jgi:hypothetical protein